MFSAETTSHRTCKLCTRLHPRRQVPCDWVVGIVCACNADGAWRTAAFVCLAVLGARPYIAPRNTTSRNIRSRELPRVSSTSLLIRSCHTVAGRSIAPDLPQHSKHQHASAQRHLHASPQQMTQTHRHTATQQPTAGKRTGEPRMQACNRYLEHWAKLHSKTKHTQ